MDARTINGKRQAFIPLLHAGKIGKCVGEAENAATTRERKHARTNSGRQFELEMILLPLYSAQIFALYKELHGE